MKTVLCKKDILPFKKDNYYKVYDIFSILDKDDFISIVVNGNCNVRFRLNKLTSYVEDYIGENETYFYDYFVDINEDRLNKLKKLI